MPFLKHFSLYDSRLDSTNIDAFPFSISFDDVWMEINYGDRRYSITSNAEFRINNKKCTSSYIKTDDLITFNDEFMMFSAEGENDNGIFVGKIRIRKSGEKLFVFKLPRKNSKQDYVSITDTMSNYSDIKNIYIDAKATQFMDGDALQSMISLVRKAKEGNCSLFFYRPSYKFKTYLKLANIEAMVPVKQSHDSRLDSFIESGKTIDRKQCGSNRYIITDNVNNYIVVPETVMSIGRLKTTCGILLSDEKISRIHALFINTNNILYLIDCNSTNFTYVNGWKVTPYCLNSLKVNDILAFGQNTNFKVKQI